MKKVPDVITELKNLCEKVFSEKVQEVHPIAPSGSPRRYFRLKTINHLLIGAYNSDIKENRAFFHINNAFQQAGIHVPKVHAISPTEDCYLQADLGDEDLYNRLNTLKNCQSEVLSWYQKAIEQLVKIQFEAGRHIDYSVCYPRAAFDRQSIQWDLNYFKYMYLKLAHVDFDEQLLENDFQELTDHLLEAPMDHFMYRDFKSKNLMVHNQSLYCIDYQGGRRGALQYDLASLLFEGKQRLNENTRKKIIEQYCKIAGTYCNFDKAMYIKYFPAFALIRILQAFGAYGYRGLHEKKQHFIESIAGGLKNIGDILDNYTINCQIPHLQYVLRKMITESNAVQPLSANKQLSVNIYSFSYKKGIPEDYSGNGGGFVFDCRFITNPGRQEQYKTLTGMDPEVGHFLENLDEFKKYYQSVENIVTNAVKNYVERGFKHLQISFGCTGGQHRSVYLAKKTANYLSKMYPVRVTLRHRELNIKFENGKNIV